MPPDPKKKPEAPDKNAPVADHKKHAAEVLEVEDYKKKPANYQDLSDEAKP